MEAMEPAHSAGVLLLIAAAAIATLLVLILKFKVHAFLALFTVSIATAIAGGVPLDQVPKVLTSSLGNTLGSIALLIALGAMIGRVLEVTGGAQVLADTLITRFGERRAPLALGVAALLFGLPIFFDAGLVVFLPIIFSVARRFGGSLLLYALPAAASFAVMHAIVPPHPGPVTVADFFGAPLGLGMLIGIPVAVVSWWVGGYLWPRFIGPRLPIDPMDTLLGELNGGRDVPAAQRPRFSTVIVILLLPLVLIAFNTVLGALATAGVVAKTTAWVAALMLLGQSPVALLLTTFVASAVLLRRGETLGQVEKLLDSALGPICSVVLITGAGGMFGGVLRTTGIGKALADALAGFGLPLIVSAFVIAAAIRVAVGSATVALTTAGGLLAPAVTAAPGLSSVDLVALVIAVAGGATVLSHVNDSGFWLVGRFFGMDEVTTLKTWTVLETLLGLTAFACAFALWTIF